MRVVASLASFILGLGVYLAAALPVAACDCMAYEGMASYAGSPDWAIFSGTVQNPEPDGTPIVVTRWFQGEGAAGIVKIDGQWGTGGASCEAPQPPAGTEWIFVANRFEGQTVVNLCTPHAAVETEGGAAMLAEAIETFGDGGAAPSEQPPPAAPGPTEGAGGAATIGDPLVVAGLFIAAGLLALVVVAAVAMAIRRRGTTAS